MSDSNHLGVPMCLEEFGLACDGSKWPPGFNTSATPRPRLGDVPYGKKFRSCTVEGTLALTYDDGPSQWTPDLLDILKEHDAKATFFVSGIKLYDDLVNHRSEKTPAIIRRMYNEGHQIAGHTWSHPDMDQLNSQQRRHELIKGEIGFVDILGFFPTYMRPPYNICGAECQTDVGELGYHVTSNDIEGRDWAGNYTFSEEHFMAKITSKGNRQGVRAWMGLAHDTHNQSVYRWTPFMIKNAKERGFKLVTAGECLNDPEENWYRDPLTGEATPPLTPPSPLLRPTPQCSSHAARSFSVSTHLEKKAGKANKTRARTDSAPPVTNPGPRTPTDEAYDISGLEARILRALEKLTHDLSQLRGGGRMNPDIVESLKVQLGTAGHGKESVRLGDIAQVVPRGRVLNVICGEEAHIKPISTAIAASPHSLTPLTPEPTNPLTIQVPLPPPTGESRRMAVAEAVKASERADKDIQKERQDHNKRLRNFELNRSVLPDDLQKAKKQMEEVVKNGHEEVKRISDGAKRVLESQ
ncbi:hypothetical protein AA0113_g1654 [Alternaria arborescens]|uniref:NodB homology domain-containing protein n=1 Tax=Alternaria arborescens TaxID=156630 RepID=A0A4Q4SM94_9PLEO|nr:hypothetical protein AA0111_g1149 [Alternaria arborescens]RYO40834.1 hypothetical protein AA0111_g1149 [Alternaria arborescens]RYO71920.1 hypothetical protein AA0113_g1654 [Alternaria arborescens]